MAKIREFGSALVPPYGNQAHGLTRFGEVWINLSEVQCLAFYVRDEWAAQITFKNCQGSRYLLKGDAAALREYLESFESGENNKT